MCAQDSLQSGSTIIQMSMLVWVGSSPNASHKPTKSASGGSMSSPKLCVTIDTLYTNKIECSFGQQSIEMEEAIKTLRTLVSRLDTLAWAKNHAEAKELKTWLQKDRLESLRSFLIEFLNGVLSNPETKSRGKELLRRWQQLNSLTQLLLTDKRLLVKLNIPSDGEYDDTVWVAAYLAGMNITFEDIKSLSDARIDTIASGYTKAHEESSSEMFIAGVAVSSLDFDHEITIRYGKVYELRSSLYEIPGMFLTEISKDDLTDFAHYLAGYNYFDTLKKLMGTPEDLIKQLRQLRIKWEASLSHNGESMESFIQGFIASKV